METDANLSAIAGTSSPSTYDAITGGSYATAQDPFTAADNGTVNNSDSGTGGASSNNVVPAPSSGSSYTPPSWLSSATTGLSSLAGIAGNINTQLAPIISGRPAASPAQAGQRPPVGSNTFTIAGHQLSTTTILVIAAAGIGAYLLLRK